MTLPRTRILQRSDVAESLPSATKVSVQHPAMKRSLPSTLISEYSVSLRMPRKATVTRRVVCRITTPYGSVSMLDPLCPLRSSAEIAAQSKI